MTLTKITIKMMDLTCKLRRFVGTLVLYEKFLSTKKLFFEWNFIKKVRTGYSFLCI